MVSLEKITYIDVITTYRTLAKLTEKGGLLADSPSMFTQLMYLVKAGKFYSGFQLEYSPTKTPKRVLVIPAELPNVPYTP